MQVFLCTIFSYSILYFGMPMIKLYFMNAVFQDKEVALEKQRLEV